jgi:hypothetical protein
MGTEVSPVQGSSGHGWYLSVRVVELPEPLKGEARRPLLLDALMLALHSASRRGASGVDPLSSGRTRRRAGW